MQQRIQKIIAQVGLASRREADRWIRQGLVTLNGKVAQAGDQADLRKDAIKVKGKLLLARQTEAVTYLLYNKPRGTLCHFGENENELKTLTTTLKKLKTRVFPVAPLDFNEEGLVLLTNDGKIADYFQKNPSIGCVYEVKVRGHWTDEQLKDLRKGVFLEAGRRFKPTQVQLKEKLKNKSLIEIQCKSFQKTEMKLLLERSGFLVERIRRTVLGPLTLQKIKSGEFQKVTQRSIDRVFDHPTPPSII